MRKTTCSAAILALALAACGSNEPAPDEGAMDSATPMADAAPRVASAELTTADGENVGNVTATESDSGITINLTARNLEAGERGVHVHMTGICEGPAFTSAGGHWNPTDAQHGLDNPQGQHAGDMPNLVVGDDGTGTLEYTLASGTFDELLDEDGSAFVIHAMRDDQVTDPSGESGDRIACGVFAAG